MKPVIKWLGGKRELCPKIKEMLPPGFDPNKNKYYEPFLGGGAVLLDLCPEEAVVNDINPELINMYLQVRDNVEDVIKYLSSLDWTHEHSGHDPKEAYYGIRGLFNSHLGDRTVDQAARFIYLNKHCFNGLYRVNSKGEFNVPFNGKLTGGSFDAEHLREVSKQIQNVEFTCCDFTQALTAAYSEEGSLVYLDPPYDPDEDIKTNGFVAYQKDGWGRHDTEKLKSICDDLTARGCNIILSNNDTAFIRELFKDYKIHNIDVRRSINRNGDNRKGKEVIITNY